MSADPAHQYPILQNIVDCNVFTIVATKGGFVVHELCDNYYSCSLSREELLALGHEIIAFSQGVPE